MSTTLPPAAFLFDFAAYMGFNTIVICSLVDNNSTDSTKEDYKEIMEQSNKYLAIAASEDCLERYLEFGKSLLLDTVGIDYSSKILNKFVTVLIPKSDLCTNLPIHLDSRVYTYEEEVAKVNLMEWYKIQEKCVSNDIGWWTMDGGVMFNTPNIWSRRANLHGITLTNVIVPHATNNYILRDAEEPTGAMAETVKSIAKALNATINWKIRKDGEWGDQCQNGTWTGIVGDLAYNKVDFSSTAMWYFPQRAAVMDYGLGIFDNSITVSLHWNYGKTNAGQMDGKMYVKTFKISGWILCLLVCLITGTIFTIFPNWHGEIAKEQAMKRQWRFLNGTIEYLAAVAQKTFKETGLQITSLKHFIFYIQMFAMGIYIIYSSALTAEFTSKGTLLEPRSFQDMLDIGIRVGNKIFCHMLIHSSRICMEFCRLFCQTKTCLILSFKMSCLVLQQIRSTEMQFLCQTCQEKHKRALPDKRSL